MCNLVIDLVQSKWFIWMSSSVFSNSINFLVTLNFGNKTLFSLTVLNLLVLIDILCCLKGVLVLLNTYVFFNTQLTLLWGILLIYTQSIKGWFVTIHNPQLEPNRMKRPEERIKRRAFYKLTQLTLLWEIPWKCTQSFRDWRSVLETNCKSFQISLSRELSNCMA